MPLYIFYSHLYKLREKLFLIVCIEVLPYSINDNRFGHADLYLASRIPFM